jgi:SAM-dependent methyltransferase
VDGIPAHSVLLMPDRETASQYPRGDMRLSFCEACGFLSNSAFDVTLNEYNVDYEETQHFSARFNQFADELVADLVNRFGIQNKRVLEIGCGKAEFLRRLCEAGNNEGIGVDPSVRPERLTAAARAKMQFIPELYSEKHAQLEADVILCRHTLEHIQPTREFLDIVRRSIGDRSDVQVCFELPDVRIVLEETRFWDVYYEHCSYFSAGSLARLFREASFDVTDLWRAYDDQYLLLMAKPADQPTVASLAIEDDLEELSALATAFEVNSQAQISHWRETIRRFHHEGRKPVLWGAGSKCVAFLTTAGLEHEVEVVVDINPHKQGKFLPATGHPVISPEQLKDYAPGVVVVMNSIYLNEVQQLLDQLKIDAEIIGT